MNKSAILHIPMSEYAYGTDEEHVTIRLRAAHGDLTKVTLFYGDRACRKTPVDFTEVSMRKVMECELYDYFEAILEKPYHRLNYYFEITDGQESLLYYGDCFCKEPVDDRSEYYQLPMNHRADIVTPPDWAQDAVIYNIFPDSFASGRRYISHEAREIVYEGKTVRGKLGGNLKGITENADYLQDLGVNAIYINPIFVAGEYHKYDLLDYFHVDPVFGTDEDLKTLVKEYHSRGIRVIIDGVFNHCGWNFFAFEDVVVNGEQSAYKDWFYQLSFPVVRPDDPEDYPNYECFGYERMMPKLNMANPETADYFVRVGEYWVREFDIDGWRLDVASEVNDTFWLRFHAAVKAVKPDAILIGEVWETANHWLDGKIFDSAMNYDFRKHCKRFFAEESIDATEFGNRTANMYMRYRRQTTFAQLNVLDSHDVSRFLSVCDDREERYRLALIFQMTFPGMPSIFYGDEMGIRGVLEADYRKPMIWEQENEGNGANGIDVSQSSDSPDEQNLYQFFKKLIQLRKSQTCLRRGDFRILQAEHDSLFIYERRTSNGECIRVALNAGPEEKKLKVDSSSGHVLLQSGYKSEKLGAYGYLIQKMDELR